MESEAAPHLQALTQAFYLRSHSFLVGKLQLILAAQLLQLACQNIPLLPKFCYIVVELPIPLQAFIHLDQHIYALATILSYLQHIT